MDLVTNVINTRGPSYEICSKGNASTILSICIVVKDVSALVLNVHYGCVVKMVKHLTGYWLIVLC